MKKCIWYVSKYVSPPSDSSAGGRGYLLMKEMAALGVDAVVITSDSNHLGAVPILTKKYTFEDRDGLRLCWIRTMKYTVAKSFRRILSWLHFEWGLFRLPKKELVRPDAIIVSSLSLLTILNGLLLKRRFGCSLIFEVRDIWPLTIVEEGGFARYNPLVLGLGWLEKIGYAYSDLIVGTMPNLSAHVTEILGYRARVECIPMGVDLSLVEGTRSSLLSQYRESYVPRGEFVVAHVGSIGIANALDTFFECAEKMKDNGQIRFLVVGDGDLKEAYQRKYDWLPNLTFAPRVPKSAVQALLERCDLLYFSVHNSQVWRYGQSLNKVVDYMMSGKPIVASYSGFPSMINEAQCGTYVPAGDPLALKEEILRYASMDASSLEKMGDRGRTWILKNRGYPSLAKRYLGLIFGSQQSQ